MTHKEVEWSNHCYAHRLNRILSINLSKQIYFNHDIRHKNNTAAEGKNDRRLHK